MQIGVVLGLAAAATLVVADAFRAPAGATNVVPAHGPVLSDCDGEIRELVIQYVPEAAGIVQVAYREFLRQLPEDVVVYVACRDKAAYDDLRSRVGPVPPRLAPICVGHTMTCWSRDRWLALAPKGGGPAVLLSPFEEAGGAVWPRRKGDGQIGNDLAAALAGHVISLRSALLFDGGDFVADAETVFVAPQVVRRNIGITVDSAAQLRRELSATLRRNVVLLPEAPPYHAGMFMMLSGERTAVVGDPSLAKRLLVRGRCPLLNPDFSDGTQHLFDAVAEQCTANGYRVVRIPAVPGEDGRTYLTYLNVIIDHRTGRRTVYMPVFRGAETLNKAAATIWRKLGYQVRPVDCTDTYVHFGSLRCLVNVLRRSSPGRRHRPGVASGAPRSVEIGP